jgi:carbonic anhydrase/acetyltransferase-like protein (isoleucine patch superfamily)
MKDVEKMTVEDVLDFLDEIDLKDLNVEVKNIEYRYEPAEKDSWDRSKCNDKDSNRYFTGDVIVNDIPLTFYMHFYEEGDYFLYSLYKNNKCVRPNYDSNYNAHKESKEARQAIENAVYLKFKKYKADHIDVNERSLETFKAGKEYELTDITKEVDGVTVHRIKVLPPSGNFNGKYEAKLCGWAESEANLPDECSKYRSAYFSPAIDGDAVVMGNARVSAYAHITGNAIVKDNAHVMGGAEVWDNAVISGSAVVEGETKIYDNAVISGNAVVKDETEVFGNAVISDNAEVFDRVKIGGDCRIDGNAQVFGSAILLDHINVTENAKVHSSKTIKGDFTFKGKKNFSGLSTLRESDNVDTSESTFSEIVLKTKAPAKEKEKAFEPIHIQENSNSRGRSR